MKRILSTLTSLLGALALAALAAGCSTGAEVSGSYQTPQSDIAVAVGFSTNSVDISGAYSNTNQVISGAINLQK